jgi:hypothetical protein
MEHDPIFPAGIHDLDESELLTYFLNDFTESINRPVLIDGLKRYLNALRSIGLHIEVWIDGSFSTKKLEPSDVDLVIFASQNELDSLDLTKQTNFSALVDRVSIKKVFGCDVLFAVMEDANLRSYWRGWYGFDRNERAKGISRLVIAP